MAIVYLWICAGFPAGGACAEEGKSDHSEGHEDGGAPSGGGAAPWGGGVAPSSSGAPAGSSNASSRSGREFHLAPAGNFSFEWPSLLFNRPSEQDMAREAVKKGYAKSLGDVLPTVKRAVKGDVLDVRLAKNDSGIWTYSFIILSADRAYVDVSVDAKRNTILGIRRR